MEIGYGSVSVYDSLRHTLYFDNINKAYFFDCGKKKYSIKLNSETINNIMNNKKILVILFDEKVYPDEAIRIWDEGNYFQEPIIRVINNYIKK